MSYTQIASLVGAVLAVGVGVAGLALGWFQSPADGLGLILAGLSILGIHQGGPVAGNIKRP